MVEVVTPLLTQLGVGGIAGLCVGYALIKIGRLIALILGIAFLGLQALAYKGIININYAALEEWVNGLIGQVGIAEGIFTTLISNLPFAASFLAGFYIGVKIS
jgi:uncharacterized membrane protein (Fun14 family)